MEAARSPYPFGIGKAIAPSVEGPTGRRKTSFVQTMEPPEEAGQSVAEVGVEAATLLTTK